MLTAFSLWLVVDLLLLPGIFRRRRTGWHQALATLGLTLLLLSLPAHIGWHTRSRIGFVPEPDTPLRLTPTETAQEVTHVGAGEPGRVRTYIWKLLLHPLPQHCRLADTGGVRAVSVR